MGYKKIEKIKESIDRSSFYPEVIINDKNFFKRLEKLDVSYQGLSIVDQYEENLKEIFLLRNPKYRFNTEYSENFNRFLIRQYKEKPSYMSGVWFFYPWNRTIVHFLPEKMHQELRTGRNRYLITAAEQKKFYSSKVGIMGMSVGSHVAIMISLTGGVKHFRLADPDILSGDNLNRVRSGFQNVGLLKVILVARQIYEINPFSNIEIFTEGINEDNLDAFMGNNQQKIDILVEETDNPFIKVRAREVARIRNIPVLMAADNGDNIIVDIERYDLNKKLPILNGVLGVISAPDFKRISKINLPKTIAKMAGADLATIRMLESVIQVGKSIYSWPQLGTAANMCGSILSYLTREIILGRRIRSGRYLVDINKIFETSTPRERHLERSYRKKLLRSIGI